MDIRQVLYYPGEITGEITADDQPGNFSSKFCIGKQLRKCPINFNLLILFSKMKGELPGFLQRIFTCKYEIQEKHSR